MAVVLASSAGSLLPAAHAEDTAVEVTRVDATDSPMIRVTVTVPPEIARGEAAPLTFRVVEHGDDRPVDVRSAADALTVAIVVDNRAGAGPGQLRALRNAAAELALRLPQDAQVGVFGTATAPATPGNRAPHPIGAIAALEPGTDGDPRLVLERAVSEVTANQPSFPVLVWLGTRVEDAGEAVEVVRGTGTALYALTLGPLEQPPFEEEIRATGGWLRGGSEGDLPRAAAGSRAPSAAPIS
jgi:hypothetical protein